MSFLLEEEHLLHFHRKLTFVMMKKKTKARPHIKVTLDN